MKKKILLVSLFIIFAVFTVVSFNWHRSNQKKLKAAEDAYMSAVQKEQSKPQKRVRAVELGEVDTPVNSIDLAQKQK
ncbi:MAG: hypothetical protein LBI01_05270 [Elusimicrobium sp.]|jgi:peptidoglycan hydrolase CwlO-like protein|nr:hypothetical protein [Elusimicrobium sp.]